MTLILPTTKTSLEALFSLFALRQLPHVQDEHMGVHWYTMTTENLTTTTTTTTSYYHYILLVHPPLLFLFHGTQQLYRQTRLLWSNNIMSHIKLFHFAAVATLLVSSLLLSITAQDAATCPNTASQPNPIAQQYPDVPSGTFNTTLAIVPIPLAQARQLIPSQFAILEGAYRALLPSFPADMYPVVMQAGLDHDIQLPAYGITVPDFQVSQTPSPQKTIQWTSLY